ncbi:ADP-ribose glycohydrolase MACROD2 isoform X1 [Xiphophorus couchianus]|uniref:ADP-ribose glycohydrolase MACROD2 isoform X1 n=1 Tax=Xiphophorus couchianus TaxID=32473 RepID=UPI001016FAC7|nr:ADP-ribose glycohydrolase MACROD2 isoform X1 [Xiphophorus couchianus]
MSKKKKDWKTEKERLLQLDREERRKEYRKGFTQLDDIPTWREENRSRTKEDDEKELTAGGGLGDKVSLYKGDITVLEVDAIVNAANTSLLGGGGVDGCIHKSAGCCLYDECHSLNGCETGKAKITCGYDLPARYVIHTVGPVARGHVGDKEIKDLTSCYKNSLDLVKEYDLRTVAFPCISTGIYGYPNEPAADIALGTVKKWIEENSDKITRVIFCVFLETDFTIYKKKMAIIFQDNDIEVTEEQLKGDSTPPSTKSTTKEEAEDGEKGKEEAHDEEKNDELEDVDMPSQPQDEDQNSNTMESDQQQNDDEHEKCEEEREMVTNNEEDDKEQDTSKEKEDNKDQKQPVPEKDNDPPDTNMEVEDSSEPNAGTSNGEDIKPVESSEEPSSIKPEDPKPKDSAESKE